MHCMRRWGSVPFASKKILTLTAIQSTIYDKSGEDRL
jgi:hypothetical protein